MKGQGYTCGHGAKLDKELSSGLLGLSMNNGRMEELPSSIVSQRRYISDRISWVMRYAQPDAFEAQYRCDEDFLLNASFDVLDWTTRSTRSGACIFIGEPFELK